MTNIKHHAKHATRKVRTVRAKRKLRRWDAKDKLDTMLSPDFQPHERTTRQEITAGIIAGLLLLVFVMIVLLVGVPNIHRLTTHNTATKQSGTHTAAQPVVAEQTYLRLTLNSWRFSEGGKVFHTYPGFRFVVLRVGIQHKYPTPTWLAPSLQSYVQDESGQQYQLTPDDEITEPLVAKQYAPGEVATGQLAYEVPQSAGKLSWCYDLGRGTAQSSPLCIVLR